MGLTQATKEDGYLHNLTRNSFNKIVDKIINRVYYSLELGIVSEKLKLST